MNTTAIVFVSAMVGLIVGALTVLVAIVIMRCKDDNKKDKKENEELQKLISERTQIIKEHEENIRELNFLQEYVSFVEKGAKKEENAESTNHYIQFHLQKLDKCAQMSVDDKFNLVIHYLDYKNDTFEEKKLKALQESKLNLDFDTLLHEEAVSHEAEVTLNALVKARHWKKVYDTLTEEEREYVLAKLQAQINILISNSVFNLPEVKALGVDVNEA